MKHQTVNKQRLEEEKHFKTWQKRKNVEENAQKRRKQIVREENLHRNAFLRCDSDGQGSCHEMPPEGYTRTHTQDAMDDKAHVALQI